MTKKYWYAFFMVVWLGETIAIALHGLPELSILQLCMFPFAVARLGRLLTFDDILRHFRSPFVKVVDHWTGVGQDCEGVPGGGFRSSFGDLLACPICSGTHAATLLLAAISIWPAWGNVLLLACFCAGAAEALFWLVELWQHTACSQRQTCKVEEAKGKQNGN